MKKTTLYVLIIILVLFVFAIIIKNHKNRLYSNPNLITNEIINNQTWKNSDWNFFDWKKDKVVCNMEYKPVCAEIQVQCIKAPCEPIKKTFSNMCELEKNKLAKFLYNWECDEWLNTWKNQEQVDLTNCETYFDGCNNCSVRNWKPDACTMMYCETPQTPKCVKQISSTTIANPASVNCEKNWWTLEIKTDSGWWQYGICHLSNGKECEEWAYFRWECE